VALIPARFIDAVVAIGHSNEDGEFEATATGFLYGFLVRETNEASTYSIFLVTCRHVLSGTKHVLVRYNPLGQAQGEVVSYPTVFGNGRPIWVAPSDEMIDIAVMPTGAADLSRMGIEIAPYRSDSDGLARDRMEEQGVFEGDEVLSLGFPMGLAGEYRNAPIARHGVIASIREMFADRSNILLIDAPSFPGNSGGPAVLLPSLTALTGTKPHPNARLIGVVAAYVPYREQAIGEQSRKPRIVFEENSGLTVVYPVDYVQEAIQELLKRKRGYPGLHPSVVRKLIL
jgi:hypothetical protein